MIIREASHDDWTKIWPIFHQVVSNEETYAYEANTSFEEGAQLWMDLPRKTFVAEEEGEIVGTYYIRTNHPGPAKHVCNCGYMVSAKARGMGVASAMCKHSQERALEMGYEAMQFNFVVSSNEVAVRLWHKLGFDTVGRLPRAYKHPQHGHVDVLVMFKTLKQA